MHYKVIRTHASKCLPLCSWIVYKAVTAFNAVNVNPPYLYSWLTEHTASYVNRTIKLLLRISDMEMLMWFVTMQQLVMNTMTSHDTLQYT